MSTNFVRYAEAGASRWGVVRDGDTVFPLPAGIVTTADVLRDGASAAGADAEPLELASLQVLHPTPGARVVCQGANYRSHMIESGMDPDRSFNMLFTKSTASLSGPDDDIVRPAHVRLLDYEVELGIVLGRPIDGPTTVTDDTLADYVGAFVVANDVSARDVQLPEGQWFKGKSYRTFCPVGPWLCVPDRDEVARWRELRLTLSVNGTERQNGLAGEMAFAPAATLSEVSLLEDLAVGDLLLTGTPGGVAMQPPPTVVQRIGGLLPDAKRWQIFVKRQAGSAKYLRPGDRVTAGIRTDDGALDLGTQHDRPMTRAPVVVIGCGPTGACAAIMLAQRGIDVLVIERWPEPYPLPRAVHFDDEVYRVLAGLGIGDQVARISRPAPGMQLVDSSLRVLAEFRRDGEGTVHGYPQANMFDQPELEAVLRARIADLDRIELRTGTEVIGVDPLTGGARLRVRDVVTSREYDLDTDAVLACDGANSAVRSMIGSRLDDLGFEQHWMVIDVTSETPLDVYPGVQQVCDHDRAATFMMVTPGRYRWEFRLRPDETADEIDDNDVLRLIRPWLGALDPAKITVLRRAWYTFRGAVADRWSTGRVFLLGDAAHLTPPFIGQGMCAGVRDAANLTWKLALVLTGVADDRLLDTYETERRPHARRVVRLAMAVGWAMTGGSALTSRLRSPVMRAAARIPGLEGRIVDAAMPPLTGGALLAPGDRGRGAPCPQSVVTEQGRSALLDDVLGAGFAVVTSGWDQTSVFDPETLAYFDALGVTVISDATSATFDRDHGVERFLDSLGARAVLVRPDRVVAASSDHVDLRAWREMLEAAGIDGGVRVH